MGAGLRHTLFDQRIVRADLRARVAFPNWRPLIGGLGTGLWHCDDDRFPVLGFSINGTWSVRLAVSPRIAGATVQLGQPYIFRYWHGAGHCTLMSVCGS